MHNDIKGPNYLVIFPENEEPSMKNLKVKLGDFNLAGPKKGGTVMFCPPEFTHGNLPGKSDIYSLGRLFLFMATDRDIFYKMLFLPVQDEEMLKKITVIVENIPILKLVSNMTKFNPEDRPGTTEIEMCLLKIDFYYGPIDLINVDLLLQNGFPVQFMSTAGDFNVDE